MDVLLQDLADSAGHFVTNRLNALRERDRLAVASAMSRGAALKLRIWPGDPADARLIIVGSDGTIVELGRIDGHAH